MSRAAARQAPHLDEIADTIVSILTVSGPSTSRATVDETVRRLHIPRDQAKFGLNHAQHTERIVHDPKSWQLSVAPAPTVAY